MKVQENGEINNSFTALPLQVMIAIAVIITAILEHIIAYVKEIPGAANKAAQAVKSTTTKASHNKLFQNIKKSYKTSNASDNYSNQYNEMYQSYEPASDNQ